MIKVIFLSGMMLVDSGYAVLEMKDGTKAAEEAEVVERRKEAEEEDAREFTLEESARGRAAT